MFRTELIHGVTKERRPVTFFEDDTIDVVRQQVSKVFDIHPDRLYILIGLQLPRSYYTQDPRNWEALFHRMSLNGLPIPRETFQSYMSEYRSPPVPVQYKESIDKETWMSYPDVLQNVFEPPGDFTEYRILGVESAKSYTLPWTPSPTASARIPAAQVPIPENTRIVTSFYPIKIVRSLICIPYAPEHELAIQSYFPFLRSTTPAHLTADQIKGIDETTQKLTDILSLDPPVPTETNVLRAKWYVKFVETEFGDAVRTRFEQIFYGLTLSEESPCVTYFTSRTEVSRHKFYVENQKDKKPILDIPMWSSWWTNSKPARNRPTLVLYRGKTRENYDRISISSDDITFSVYRDINNKDTLETMRESVQSWFATLDAVTPFINTADMVLCRWELQEVRFSAKYAKDIDELDMRRINCIQFLFSIFDLNKSMFRLLRADSADEGVSPIEFRILQLLRENPGLTPSEIDFLPINDASYALNKLQSRLEEDPDLIQRVFSGYPVVQFTHDRAIMNSARSIDLPLRYINILRYILSDPMSKEVDRVCPKRMETVSAEKVVVPTTIVEMDQFADLFGYLEEAPQEEKKVEPEQKRVRVPQKTGTYKYFYQRLQEFDPITFNPKEVKEYPKTCEKSRQPIILSEEELGKIMEEYDPRTNLSKNKLIDVNDPSGVVVCPEYWCMYDRIPIQESQLEKVDGVPACPVCKGKLRDSSDTKSDLREFPLVQRTKGFVYPGMTDSVSPANGKALPCCFRTPREKKLKVDEKEGKSYILGITKIGLGPLRLAYLSPRLLASVHISETYKLPRSASDRIQSGASGYFRVGIGSPSETLPTLIGLKTKIAEPKDNIAIVLKCSFVSSWKDTNDKYSKEIAAELEQHSLFSKDESARNIMSRIISGIQVAYEEKTLIKMYELEYAALALKIDIFRIHLDSHTISCLFTTILVRLRTRGIIILQNGEDIDILSHVTRIGKDLEFRSNLYDNPFTEEQSLELEKLRNTACATVIPRFDNAIRTFKELIPEFGDDISIIYDPFGRGQAVFFPNKMILPFQNSPTVNTTYTSILGYHSIRDDLPTYESAMRGLEIISATKYAYYYEYDSDIYDVDSNVVEIMLKNGLRIAVKPFKKGTGPIQNEMTSILDGPETTLVFGERNAEDVKTYKNISYASEIYDYLLFQLSKDIQVDNTRIRRAISAVDETALEPLLQKWFDDATVFVGTPVEFVSKIRVPCGQFKKKDACENSTMCAWNGKQCRIKVKETVSKPALFRKLLHALIENSKTRALVLDARITPFFSTILYIELPHELILTDLDIRSKIENMRIS